MSIFLSKRRIFVIIVLLVAVLLAVYFESRPRIAPGQKQLSEIQSIETLRAQFNKDAGKTRLILLISPT